jgi:hypothetical protein
VVRRLLNSGLFAVSAGFASEGPRQKKGTGQMLGGNHQFDLPVFRPKHRSTRRRMEQPNFVEHPSEVQDPTGVCPTGCASRESARCRGLAHSRSDPCSLQFDLSPFSASGRSGIPIRVFSGQLHSNQSATCLYPGFARHLLGVVSLKVARRIFQVSPSRTIDPCKAALAVTRSTAGRGIRMTPSFGRNRQLS